MVQGPNLVDELEANSFGFVYGWLAAGIRYVPNLLYGRARARHTLYRQLYAMKVLCKYVRISHPRTTRESTLKMESSNFNDDVTVYVTNTMTHQRFHCRLEYIFTLGESLLSVILRVAITRGFHYLLIQQLLLLQKL
jgi:hypothetical protein